MAKNESDWERHEREAMQNYLDEHVFAGLANLNDGFDTEVIKWFSCQDFSIGTVWAKRILRNEKF